MAKGLVLVSAEGAKELQQLNRRMKNVGNRQQLRGRLKQEIQDAGEPVVRDLRAAVMGVSVSSSRGGTAEPDRSTGLRRRVARATTLSVTTSGVRIRVAPKKVSKGQSATGRSYGETLPKYLDASVGRFDRWRHPVFGNPDVWAQQQGQPWFFVTIRRHRRDFRRAVFAAMEDVADLIVD